jgi:hypothetical protein
MNEAPPTSIKPAAVSEGNDTINPPPLPPKPEGTKSLSTEEVTADIKNETAMKIETAVKYETVSETRTTVEDETINETAVQDETVVKDETVVNKDLKTIV